MQLTQNWWCDIAEVNKNKHWSTALPKVWGMWFLLMMTKTRSPQNKMITTSGLLLCLIHVMLKQNCILVENNTWRKDSKTCLCFIIWQLSNSNLVWNEPDLDESDTFLTLQNQPAPKFYWDAVFWLSCPKIWRLQASKPSALVLSWPVAPFLRVSPHFLSPDFMLSPLETNKSLNAYGTNWRFYVDIKQDQTTWSSQII